MSCFIKPGDITKECQEKGYSTVANNFHDNKKRNTVEKENLTNKKVLLTCKKRLLPYKQYLIVYTK